MKLQLTRVEGLLTACLVITLLLLDAGIFDSVSGQDQGGSAKGAAVFKTPDGYMRAPLTDFRGMFLFDPKNAAGMFVTYGNDNETTGALRQRILTAIGPMFIRDREGKFDATTITWTAQELPSHPGDGGPAATNTYTGSAQEVQVAIYERTGGPRPFLYGYFAMRHKAGKKDDGKFLDAKGEGVKAFDKLWKSFPK